MQQSAGAVSTVFKQQASDIQKWAASAWKTVGLSQNQAQQSAAILGAQLKNLGILISQLEPKTKDLIKLGADLSATYGGTAADAVEALSALLGERETDPIEKYGRLDQTVRYQRPSRRGWCVRVDRGGGQAGAGHGDPGTAHPANRGRHRPVRP